MNKSRKHILTRNQLIGAVALILMIIAVRVFLAFVPRHNLPESHDVSVSADSMSVMQSPRELLFFDPNTADSVTLLHNGLKPWQIRNMMKYRAKGGRYRTAEDFRRLYGLTDSAFSALKPFIRIDNSEWEARRDSLSALRRERDSLRHLADSLRRDSLFPLTYRHPKRDTIIELNAADTSDLQYIRGIGAYTARQIIRYRKQLGGFVSPEQLREIKELQQTNWDLIVPHLWAEKDSVKQIPVNTASVKRLQAHPYISFEQAKALYELRRTKIRLTSINDIMSLVSSDSASVFSREWVVQIEPYISFAQSIK